MSPENLPTQAILARHAQTPFNIRVESHESLIDSLYLDKTNEQLPITPFGENHQVPSLTKYLFEHELLNIPSWCIQIISPLALKTLMTADGVHSVGSNILGEQLPETIVIPDLAGARLGLADLVFKNFKIFEKLFESYQRRKTQPDGKQQKPVLSLTPEQLAFASDPDFMAYFGFATIDDFFGESIEEMGKRVRAAWNSNFSSPMPGTSYVIVDSAEVIDEIEDELVKQHEANREKRKGQTSKRKNCSHDLYRYENGVWVYIHHHELDLPEQPIEALKELMQRPQFISGSVIERVPLEERLKIPFRDDEEDE